MEATPNEALLDPVTKERLIEALRLMPDGAPVKFGMYLGEGQWAVSGIIGILVGAGDDEVVTILLRVPTPEAVATVAGLVGRLEDDYEPGTEH